MINNFIKRAITGVLFVAILVGCILYDAFSFGILFTVISALTIYEFAQLVNMRAEGVKINKTINMLGGAYLFLAIMGFCIDAADSKIFIPYVLLLLYMMISELYLKKENPVLNWAYSMLSQLYIGLPFALLNVLAFHNDPASEFSSISYNPILPLSIFIFLWLNDTGAYCIGSLIGKHRLYRRRSCSNRSIFYTCSLLPIYVNDGMGRTGIGSGYIRYMGRPDGVIAKTPIARKGFGKYSSGTWRDARSV